MVSKYKKSLKAYAKSCAILNVLKVVRLMLGHYFNLSSSKIVSWMLRIYCICITFTTATVNIISFTSLFTLATIEYIICILLSLQTGDEYFFKYCTTIKTIDAIMGYRRGSIFENNIVVSVLASIITIITFTSFNYSEASAISLSLVFHTVMMTSIRTNYLLVVIVLFTTYNRMKYVKQMLEENNVPVNIIGKNETADKIMQIRKTLISYNNLLDNLRGVGKEVQYLMFMMLAIGMPTLIFYIYSTIKAYLNCHKSATTVPALVMGAQMIDLFLQICLPAIIATLINIEADQIKKILNKQLLRCSDASLRFELEIALSYVIRRPFRFTIWRSNPLDITLPSTIITFCITYVIITIQFTQFKDL